MAERVLRQRVDVLRDDVVAAAEEGERPGRLDEADRAARARAEGDERRELGQPVRARIAGRGRELDGVADDARVDVDGRGRLLQLAQPLQLEHAAELRRGDERALHDRQLLVVLGIADEDLEHEAVDLCLGQRVGALGLDRVLRRHHEERRRHGVRVLSDRHLALLHHLEQRRLHLRRGAVDLVREQEVAEDGAELGVEVGRAGAEDARADEVGGDEVGRELDPLEAAAEHLRGRLDRQRLGETGDALDQEVAACEQADEDALEHPVLPRDHPLDLEQRLLEQLALLLYGRLAHGLLLARGYVPPVKQSRDKARIKAASTMG